MLGQVATDTRNPLTIFNLALLFRYPADRHAVLVGPAECRRAAVLRTAWAAASSRKLRDAAGDITGFRGQALLS
jgi:hypothetical protein